MARPRPCRCTPLPPRLEWVEERAREEYASSLGRTPDWRPASLAAAATAAFAAARTLSAGLSTGGGSPTPDVRTSGTDTPVPHLPAAASHAVTRCPTQCSAPGRGTASASRLALSRSTTATLPNSSAASSTASGETMSCSELGASPSSRSTGSRSSTLVPGRGIQGGVGMVSAAGGAPPRREGKRHELKALTASAHLWRDRAKAAASQHLHAKAAANEHLHASAAARQRLRTRRPHSTASPHLAARQAES